MTSTMTRDKPPISLGSLAGTIERRLLINFRVDPAVAAKLIPAPFTPALVHGYAIAGICLIQLRVRPTWLPRRMGLRSLNGAHRFAVILPDGSDAVYIPRRDTNSRLNVLAGGRIFPGTHHPAQVMVEDLGHQVSIEMISDDGKAGVSVTASTAAELPKASIFENIDAVSDFFEQGSLGYSDTPTAGCYDGIELDTGNWSVTPMEVDQVESTFFDDKLLFPHGSAELDNALLMRDIDHTWQAKPSLTSAPR